MANVLQVPATKEQMERWKGAAYEGRQSLASWVRAVLDEAAGGVGKEFGRGAEERARAREMELPSARVPRVEEMMPPAEEDGGRFRPGSGPRLGEKELHWADALVPLSGEGARNLKRSVERVKKTLEMDAPLSERLRALREGKDPLEGKAGAAVDPRMEGAAAPADLDADQRTRFNR